MIPPAINLSCGHSTISISLFGAHILSWKQNNKEQLWLSEWAKMDGATPIRGGIPLCCPWFAHKSDDLPMHGFFRTMIWQELIHTESEEESQLILELKDNADTRGIWSYRFYAQYQITLRKNSLSIQLQVTNCDPQSFDISGALHTYFGVNDHQDVSIPGLKGYRYFDKYAGKETIFASDKLPLPIDGITHGLTEFEVTEPDQVRRVQQIGNDATVIWNPAPEKLAADIKPGTERAFFCFESAKVLEPETLKPGEQFTLGQTISIP